MSGRPRALADEAKRKAVAGILLVGGTRETAARFIGVHPRTLANEIRRDPAFARQIREAEIGCEVGLLRTIRDAGKSATHWRAAAWELERRYPERYRRRDPGLFTLAQVDELLEQLAAAILDEIPGRPLQRRVLTRVNSMLGRLDDATRKQLADRHAK